MMNLTNKQTKELYLLSLEGLKREIEFNEAVEAYNTAREIQKTAKQYVIDNNKFYNDLENDPDNGELITDASIDYLINSDIFSNEFLPKLKDAYMKLYGIDNPLDFDYTYPMFANKIKAEKHWYMVAVEFLKVCGSNEEAKTLEEAINGYMKPSTKANLVKLIESFTGKKAA